jgi:TonB family protein
VYLWKGKSTLSNQIDSGENVVGSKNTAEVKNGSKNENISQTKKSDDKSISEKSRAIGKVTVQILIDVDGNVVSAKAVDGDSLLAEAAVKAARQSKFAPTMIAGYPVQISGSIIYNFVP